MYIVLQCLGGMDYCIFLCIYSFDFISTLLTHHHSSSSLILTHPPPPHPHPFTLPIYPSDLEDDKDKAKERARRRVLNSSMLRDALQDHTEDPEVVYNQDVLRQKAIKKRRELEE